METRVVTVDPQRPDAAALRPVAETLRAGGIVALPTETVYGLAVNLDHPGALDKLLKLRGSPLDKKVTIHIGSPEAAEKHAAIPPCGLGRRLITRLWPGPVTLVFPAKSSAEDVGLRYPDHRATCEVIRQSGVRIGMPSANLSGRPPATTAQEVREVFGDKLDAIVDAGPTRVGTASTVVRVTGGRIEILREGAVPRTTIEELSYRAVLFVCTGNTCRSPMAERIYRKKLAAKLGIPEAQLGERGHRVSSAGTMGISGVPAAEHSVAVVRDLGIDLSDHRSRGLTIALVQDADVTYVLAQRHREVILEWMPECRDQVKLLDPSGEDIADPIGLDLDAYRACARKIASCIDQRLAEEP